MLHVPSGHTRFPYNPEHFPSTHDFVISNNIYNITKIATLNELDSDHLPILLTIANSANDINSQNENREITFDFDKVDWEKFTKLLNYEFTIKSKYLSKEGIDFSINNITTRINHCIRELEYQRQNVMS